MNRYHLAILAYSGVQQAAVLGLADLFSIANGLGDGQIDVHILAPESLPARSFDALLLPPNISRARGAADTDIHGYVIQQRAGGCVLGAACAGVFWLGHAGVLDGRDVTTHWALEAEFHQAFPSTNLLPDQLLIAHPDLVTAGGMMAWVDLGLCFVERFLGYETAAITARHLLVDLRGREQRHYRRFQPVLTHGDQRVLAVQHWIEAHFAEPIKIATLAVKSVQSERSFLRHFKAATGMPPGAYVQAVRIEKARGKLERSFDPVSSIAWQVGYADIPAFTRVFKTITGLSPRAYRNRFNARRPSGPA